MLLPNEIKCRRSPCLQNSEQHAPSSSSNSRNRLHCTGYHISLPMYTFRHKSKKEGNKNRGGCATQFPVSVDRIFSSASRLKSRRHSQTQDWQCLANILTLSTNPLMRSSYWLDCPFIRSWPCLRTSSEETSISSSCSFSVLEVAYHSFSVSLL